jgi:RimJ/RimL family protein N-acetyltransferase
MSTDPTIRHVTRNDYVQWLPLWNGCESARGKGIGKALINGVYDQAKHSGCPRVYWQTHETNKTTRRLYDQVADNSGFIVYRNREPRTEP